MKKDFLYSLIFALNRFIGKILSVIPYCIPRLFVLSSNTIHSSILQAKFKKCGKKSFIERPFYMRGEKYIEIGNNFICNARGRMDALRYLENDPEIIIGNNVNINYDCHIGCVNKIIIGNDVLIASKVYITDHSHGGTDYSSLKIPPRNREVTSSGPVIIKDNVWIGEGAVILPNVTIGENSVIGANSVVTKDVLPFTVVAGVPAKVIKSYCNQI